eukprot:CAMPEP_0173103666 /NCGR_PEP_ID=MMETSP1102-20130122/38546_1 /TAXON_ID=49646 /ORGANISM="Geminigera sp., Strain Caron Lab Isolate" /LENGTH=32 /DNA_ID= /DNA_START= /DNA_END= /DNA_ORIENTATION=
MLMPGVWGVMGIPVALALNGLLSPAVGVAAGP